MKKLLGLLVKKERKSELYNLGEPGSSQVGSNYVSVKYAYTNRPFDSDCCNSRDQGHEKTESRETVNSFESLSNSLASTNSLAELFESETEKELQVTNSESSDSEEKSSPTVSLCDGIPPEKKEKKVQEKRPKKNQYVINIINSKYFHIGSQKIINASEKQMLRIQSSQAKFPESNYSTQFETTFNKLLDCEKKLTEAEVSLISLHINEGWRSFLELLELEEAFLRVLEFRNDHDRVLTVYDAVQKYLILFPNTSVGFICSTLFEIKQVTVLQKLALEFNYI